MTDASPGGPTLTSAEEFVALRTSQDRDLYMRAAHAAAPEMVWLDVIARYPEMRFWVAQNKTVPVSILAILADDPDPRVRSMVAAKRKAGAMLLEKLARDNDAGVRHAVACNRRAPDAVLRLLLEDQESFVAEAAEGD